MSKFMSACTSYLLIQNATLHIHETYDLLVLIVFNFEKEQSTTHIRHTHHFLHFYIRITHSIHLQTNISAFSAYSISPVFKYIYISSAINGDVSRRQGEHIRRKRRAVKSKRCKVEIFSYTFSKCLQINLFLLSLSQSLPNRLFSLALISRAYSLYLNHSHTGGRISMDRHFNGSS